MRPYPHDERYLVNADGRIFSTVSGKYLKPLPDTKGYMYVGVRGRNVGRRTAVHHMVLETYVGDKPDGYEAAHGNGVKDDNRLSNLAWKTSLENNLDIQRHDRCRMPFAKVEEIREAYSRVGSKNAVARMFPEFSRTHIRNILNGKSRQVPG